MRGFLLVALVAGTSIFSGSARGETPPGRWYGWQLALADAAALGLIFAPVDQSWRGATVTVGLTGLFINGSVVNMVHGNAPAASRSLLRLPAFLIGRLAGFAAGGAFCQESGCKAPLLTAGSAFGIGTVMILDLLDAFQPAPWWLPEPEIAPPPTGIRASPLADQTPGPRRGLQAPMTLAWPLAAGRF